MIDVIMLSKGDDNLKRSMTQRAIRSIISNSKDEFNIIVVETIPGVTYKNCTVIHPDKKFNYNEFTQIAYKKVKSDYVFFVNNDIICLKNCTDILRNGLEIYDCVCPSNPRDVKHTRLKEEYSVGTDIWNPSRFTGWAFMLKKTTIDSIGIKKLFPIEIEAWFSDNWITKILDKFNLKNALVRSARLQHLQSVTLRALNREDMVYYTEGQREKYHKLLATL